MQNVAIFGAAGAIGSAVAPELERRGVPFRVVGRSRQKLEQAFGKFKHAEIFPRMAEELNAYGTERRVGVLYKLTGKFARCALDPALSERLVRRFVASIIDNSGAGESLSIDVGAVSGMCAVAVVRPSTLRDTTSDELFDPAFTGPGDEQIGLGFAFRLVRGLARIAGGDLRVDADRFTLLVPPAR